MGRRRGRAWGGKARVVAGASGPNATPSRPPRWCPAAAFPPQPPGVCRFCKKAVPKGRLSWCSEACVDQYMALRSPMGLRRAVWNRDKGVCVICTLDCTLLESIITPWRKSGNPAVRAVARELRAVLGVSSRKAYWDADHKLAVRDGGGSCGLGNVQTVCVWCHRRKNAEELDQRNGKPPADPRRPSGRELVAAALGPARAAVAEIKRTT